MAVVLMAAPAAAQQYPPAVNGLTCPDTTPTPGQTLTLQARTFATGATATFELQSVPVGLGTATADASGVATLEATIPTDTTLGAHTIAAVGPAPDGSQLSLSCSITVVAAGAAAGDAGPSGSLPRTGDDSSIPLAKLGLALAALGGAATAVASKRRKRAAAAA
jgi:LPXTG-motif cell wall-anchored protein